MRNKTYIALLTLTASLSFLGAGSVLAAEDTKELAFAQCEEYINVRSEASTDSSVVAQIYNNGSAYIVEEDGEWYKIQSGNATGYVKAEYFVTGDEADAIASEVAYHVAVVYPQELNVRTDADEASEVLEIAKQSEELEVVASEGDWKKVALGNDVYGYVNANYVESKTYYPTALTLEEIAAKEAEAAEANAGAEDGSESNTTDDWTEGTSEAAEEAYTEEMAADSYTEDISSDTADSYTEDTSSDTADGYTEDTSSDTSDSYTEESTSDGTDGYTDDSYIDDGASDTTDSYTEEDVYEADEAPAETGSSADTYYETESTEYQESTEAASGSDSSTGQAIADYAVQFVGNPYVYGGTSLTDGADCSGFTMSVFANFGIGLSHNAAAQSGGGTSVSLSDIQAGDLLFYSDGSGISHVAIYIGGGQIVHASNSNTGIIISSYNYSTPVSASRYW